jgi:hypothetical protein
MPTPVKVHSLFASGSFSLECIHIFLWVAKDLCWMLDIFEMAVVFGSLALAWWYVPV